LVGVALKLATGPWAAALTVIVREVLLEPLALVAVKVTVKVPALLKVWLGFFTLLVPPSPKLQDQLVGELVEVSVKLTARGAVPLVGLALKPATGAGEVTVIVFEVLLEPLLLEAVKVTV
jgi:hypothetical protein